MNESTAKALAFNFIHNGHPKLARSLRKIVAFDTRFSLYQKDIKHLYLLEHPIFDQRFEVVYEDGSKKLIDDDQAVELLKKERDYNEEMKQKAADQVRKVSKIAKMSDLGLDPKEDFEQLVEEVEEEAPDVAPLLEIRHDDEEQNE